MERVILASARKLFHPIGVVYPILICTKLMLQNLTEVLRITEVELEAKEQFLEWYFGLKLLEHSEMPLWILSAKE